MTSLRRALGSTVAPFAAAVALVVSVSIVAYAGQIPAFVAENGIDKGIHATMSAVLTALLTRVIRRPWLAALIVLVPLAIDEYLQRYSPHRSSDWADMAADVLGAGVAVLAILASRWRAAPTGAAASR